MAGVEVGTVPAPESSPHAPASLAAALERSGPLAGPLALVIGLQLCADTSALGADALARDIGSLATTHILRDPHGAWRWRPGPTGVLNRRPTDNEVAGRIGAVLFECVTGVALRDYLPETASVRERLRDRRPDLPQATVDVIADLASARSGRRVTLDEVARTIRRALGVRDAAGPWSDRGWSAGLALVVLLVAGGLWMARADPPEPAVESHGLDRDETIRSDALTDSSEFWTLRGEYLEAFAHLDELRNLWRARVPENDPRIADIALRRAWARDLRGDALSAEQSLVQVLAPLEQAIGGTHPYVRAARLHLADLLERRGARDRARAQRQSADAAVRVLLPEARLAAFEARAAPPASGIVAHVAPILPELEGFRRDAAGGYGAPLTYTTRWMAGRDGWRLHVTATGECRVAVDAGRDPRRLRVAARRVDATWEVTVGGIAPPLNARVEDGPDGRVAVSVEVGPDDEARVFVQGDAPRRAVVDAAAEAQPPYGLTFSGVDGCALVWWEVQPAVGEHR